MVLAFKVYAGARDLLSISELQAPSVRKWLQTGADVIGQEGGEPVGPQKCDAVLAGSWRRNR